MQVDTVHLRVKKAGLEADAGLAESQSLSQLEQVEVEAGQAEGEAETEAPGSPSVGQEPHTGGSSSGDSEIKKDTIQSGPLSLVEVRPDFALIG